MILYFTGTGNSRYVAQKIADKIKGELLNLNELIKRNETVMIQAENLVFVTPTFAWRIPRIIRDWILKADFSTVKKVWFVMTCGSEIGNASIYNQKLCRVKGCEYMGTAQVIMPENYIAMFVVPNKEKAEEIILNAHPVIDKAAKYIAEGEKLPAEKNSLYYRLLSGVVNPLFYPVCVKAKAFRADGRCIGCSRCAEKCPLNNISIVDGKPVWGKNCTHCMACICYCPTEAIEYGRKSKGKPRYHL
ncbi:MAG TPA: EFR1 family ferrodoxin [Candidatus Atribacteria bacterium]|nr:EFR1 family ferrodoxin [Candidatus Atribacteria bacterium]HPT78494.1 EFR1 family ferrodoxin [Candidatus Atribacteria bacterium]